MGSASIRDKVIKRLARYNNLGETTPQIIGYNPYIRIEYSDVPPYTLTVYEEVDKVILKTVYTYDKKYPTGRLISISEQEAVQLDDIPPAK